MLTTGLHDSLEAGFRSLSARFGVSIKEILFLSEGVIGADVSQHLSALLRRAWFMWGSRYSTWPGPQGWNL